MQEHALTETNNRIQQLQWELEAARREGQAQQSRGGMFGGLFGGDGQQPPPMPPPPQPQHAPGYQQMAQQGRTGSGFLGTAAAVGAGAVGGLVLGNVLSDVFSNDEEQQS